MNSSRTLTGLLALWFTLDLAPARAGEEDELLATLRSSAPITLKADACRQLRLAGTARAVPVLAELLADERLSHAARHALEGLPYPEAVIALRVALALDGIPANVRIGLIDSLGWRRDTESIPVLHPLLVDPDEPTAVASAIALGRIGGPRALAILEAARERGTPPVRGAIREALFESAERLLAAGDRAAATKIYQSLLVPSEPDHVRQAAHAGRIRAAGDDALALVRSALEGNDGPAQAAALQIAGEPGDPAMGRFLAERLPSAPPALQVALLAALQRRGEPGAAPVVLAVAPSSDPAVQAAAAAALGIVGDASAVPWLAEAATSTDPTLQTAARDALLAVHRGDVTAALANPIGTAAPAVQRELFRALGARAEPSSVAPLLALARSDRPATRTLALQALGRAADGRHLGLLVQLLAEAGNDDDREEVRGVFETIIERRGGAGALDVEPILNGLNAGDPASRSALLQVSALLGDPKLRPAFRAALRDPDVNRREEAIRALCSTRDADLLPDLVAAAGMVRDERLKSLAIDGSVRLATDEQAGLSAQQRVHALAMALEAAARPSDKRTVLSGLGQLGQREALDLAERAAADAAVRPEAELASLRIAQRLGAAEFTTAEAVLRRLAASAVSAETRTNAQAVLKQLDSGWLYAGPYRQEGKEAQELFDLPFGPEVPNGGPVPWQRAPGSTDVSRVGEVDLSGVTGGNHCVLYAKTRVRSPIDRDVRFAIGSDDGIKLWLNGEIVHANNAVRGLTPGQDRARGRLRAGWNELLAKITQHTAGCGMTLRITGADGAELSDLTFDARGGEPGGR